MTKMLCRTLIIVGVVMISQLQVYGSHVVGGEIYWECVTSGPDAGKIVFYLKMNVDCVNQPTDNLHLDFLNHPSLTTLALSITSETSTSFDCGEDCSDNPPYMHAVKEIVYTSLPIAITGTPPNEGWKIMYERCCRAAVENLIDAQNNSLILEATMYPYNGQDMFPCYDSAPSSAIPPSLIQCSGYELRYNAMITDPDRDSLSYEFIPAISTDGTQLPYTFGFSFDSPLPGPDIDASYSPVTLNPSTGQLRYDIPNNVEGAWSVDMAVNSWRCGHIISRTTKSFIVSATDCLTPNSTPTIHQPNWISPINANGTEITVMAGEPVSFSLTATDPDNNGVNTSTIEMSVLGEQFGTDLSNPNSGCDHPPCATLSPNSLPMFSTDSITTVFNWQTSCDHITVQNECASSSTTYNFVFQLTDDHCPVSGTSIMNVAITVLGEFVVSSPLIHCVNQDETGNIEIEWAASTDDPDNPTFVEYAIFHSTSATGPFLEIDAVADINSDGYIHSISNPIAAPSQSQANYYLIRTRSGCNNSTLDAPSDTVSNIFLEIENSMGNVNLLWSPLSTPLPYPIENELYFIYREYPIGTWLLIDSTANTSYSDPVFWEENLVNYRIELGTENLCLSVSNISGEVVNSIDHLRVSSFHIVPNPTSGTFNLVLNNLNGTGSYKMIDIVGRTVLTGKIEVGGASAEISTSLPSGSYLMVLTTTDRSDVQHLIIK